MDENSPLVTGAGAAAGAADRAAAGAEAAGAGAAVSPTVHPTREAWPDNLRLVLISGVIVAHVATAYVVDLVSWYYEQRTTSELAITVLSFPILLGAIFGLGPLFVLAGWLSSRTLARRGAGHFVRGRLVRLGIPLVVFTLLIDPVADYLGKVRTQPWLRLSDYLTDRTGTRDMGPLWFVAALLVFSLVYAAWRTVRPVPPPGPATMPDAATHVSPDTPTGPPLRVLVVAGAVVAVASLVLWQVWHHGTATPMNANWPHWPQAATMFTLGVLAGERGWLEALPWPRARHLGRVAGVGVLAIAALAGFTIAAGDVDVMTGGPHWEAAALATLDGLVAVTWVWWLLALFRRRWNAQRRWAERASRGSYAAYLMHPVVLVLLSLAVHAAPWPAEAKFLLVAAVGVPLTFLVGYGLTRVPWISRIV